MEAPLLQQCINKEGFIIRPFSDFILYLRNYTVPKGAVMLFKGNIPAKGWEEVTDITPPTGYKYGVKLVDIEETEQYMIKSINMESGLGNTMSVNLVKYYPYYED